MRQSVLRWGIGMSGGSLLLGLMGLTRGGFHALAEPAPQSSITPALATSSIVIERGIEALLQEQAVPPALFPEIYTTFPQAVPPPIVGGLQAEIE